MNKYLRDFFREYAVFRHADILNEIPYYQSRRTELANSLNYYVRSNKLVSIRRNLYGVVAEGSSKEEAPYSVDPLLLASKMTEDAVVSYHSALSIHGCLHSSRFDFSYSTQKRVSKTLFEFAGNRYISAQFSKALGEECKEFLVEEKLRVGQALKVTTLERTFVDVLSRPALMGHDWEEIIRSLEKAYLNDLNGLVKYLKLLNSKMVSSRVGYFLERTQNKKLLPASILEEVKNLSLNSVSYLDSKSNRNNVFVKKWNLMVPSSLHNSNWEEIK